MNSLRSNIETAMARKSASLVLKNASIINVFTQKIDKADIAINEDLIVGVGEYSSSNEIDCSGMYVAPGFIDAHVHIESSMVTPEIFSHLVIGRGVTTIVADPHEIANSLGEEGISFMLQNSEKGVIDTCFMLPSCVPAVAFEDNGATLDADSLSKFISDPRVLGLGEVMDVPAVVSASEGMLKKLCIANKSKKYIDGHSPRITEKELNAFLAAGIKTDHECTTYEEALKKVQLGMYVMLREGSAARDVVNLLPAVNKENYSRFLFCTDDRHIEDLVEEGSIDNCIRTAIKNGMEPVMAYTIASFNPANCYNFRDRGAVARGFKADLVIIEDIRELNIKNVLKNGKIYKGPDSYSTVNSKASVNHSLISEDMFRIECKGEYVNVIKASPGTLETKKEVGRVVMKDGTVKAVVKSNNTVNKIAVFERYKGTGKYSIGFIEGFDLKDAAIAQTIAHDSHNIIVVGDNDKDMEVAVNNIIKIGGGIVLASGGRILESLSLPIGGLLTSEDPKKVLTKVKRLNMIAREHGIKRGVDPYLALGFMALPVIPDIKITARGLFDYSSFSFTDLFINP